LHDDGWLAICFCLVGVQAVGAAAWIAMDFPHTTYAYLDRRLVILRCKTTNMAIMMSLTYNMVLIALCTVYAFKTRNIPENFNETKYIAFTMYSTCIVWLAFVPIYFSTDRKDFKVRRVPVRDAILLDLLPWRCCKKVHDN